MSNEEQLRAKTLALFHSLLSTWANDLRGEVSAIQDGLISQLDSIQSRMATYEENIDEGKILAFVQELGQLSGGGGGGTNRLPQVRASMAQLENGNSLQEVLNTLVHEISQFAPRVALFVIKGGNCIGWNGLGFDQSPGFSNDALKRISVPANADTVFRAVMQSRQRFFGESSAHRDNAHLLSRIGTVLPTNIFSMPLILRDKVAAVIYADSGDSREALADVEAVEILVLYASRLLDLMNAAKTSGKTGEFQSDRMTALKEPATPVPAPPAPPAPAPPVVSAPASGAESGTVMLNIKDIEAQALSQAAPASVPTSAPSSASPASLDSMDADTRKLHEDAMRFARLLISEIKLYNEAKVQQGRQKRGIYNMLRDDIERSRQLYSERVSSDIRDATNYFNEELVRILADGDAAALGQQPN